MAEPNSTTLPTPIPTSLNVTALAKRFGVARTTIQRRLKKGWVPPATVPRKPARRATPDAAPSAAPAAAPLHPTGRGLGLILVVTAFAIAALAVVINAQTGMRFGTTPLAGITFAGLSIAADVLAIVLPSAAVALWWSGRRALSGGAWAVWVLASTMAASVGFASLHISDTAAARAAIVSSATATTERRNAAIDAARAAADAASKARSAECQRRGPKWPRA